MVDQDAQVRGEISGVGMVVAESAATPGQGVLISIRRASSWP
jgi:hypothetical protein